MKIVLTCGHLHSGFRLLHDVLVASGLSEAKPSRRESISPAELHASISAAYSVDDTSASRREQLAPGKVWQDLTVDLMMGNLDQNDWGWADASTVWLLEFWKNFDPNVRFILCYSSLENAIGEMLQNREATPQHIETTITSWIEVNAELLRFYHRNHGRCILVNAAVIQDPTQLIEVATSRLSLASLKAGDLSSLTLKNTPAIVATIAKRLIEDITAAASLYSELESAADLHVSALTQEKAERYQALQEYASLLSRLEKGEQQEQARNVQIDRLQKEIDEAQRQLSRANELADEHSLRYARAYSALVSADGEAKQLQDQKTNLTDEIELLKLRLLQAEEEVDHYVREYQRVADIFPESTPRLTNQHSQLLVEFQPDEIAFDLRRHFAGSNWYYSEDDGRWAGPSQVSTIEVPALRAGSYEILLNVVDAMEPEILTGMEVHVNGTKISTTMESEAYPARVIGRFSTTDIESSSTWEFRLAFPKVVSPSQHGSDDRRFLAIRARSLRLRLTE